MQRSSSREAPLEIWRRLVSQSAPELKGRLTALTILLVVAIGLVDYLLGFELSIMVFYFVPVALAVVCRGWGFGVVIAVACVVSWISGDLAAGAHYGSRLVPIWNAIIVLLTYLVLIALLTSLLNLQRVLEVRVARRTAALASEVAERERLEKAILEITERERRSIGHDLHDSLGQHLTGTALTGQVLAEKLQDRNAPEVADACKLVGLVKSAIEQTRQMAKGLLLADIDRDGLTVALQEFCSDTSLQFHVDCRFHGDGPLVLAEDGVASHVYRIGQEAIRNAVRHSRARTIDVSLKAMGDRIVLRVADDGIGLPQSEARGPGIGIRIMTHRAQMIGADFAIDSRPEGGTRVMCIMPRPASAAGYAATSPIATSATIGVAGGEAQRFVEGKDIPGDWWKSFHSKPLDDLIDRALANSPDIKSAQAALLVARETVLSQRGAYWPGLSGNLAASRNKTSADISPTPNSGDLYYNLYTPQVSVSFVPDVFGLNRRAVEALKAQQKQARFALAASHIALSANVATAAIQEASLRAQIEATRRIVASNEEMLRLLHAQFVQGYASRLDVAAQESQLAQVQTALPPLLKQLGQQRDLLAALAGEFPNNNELPKIELASLHLPVELPLSLPSRLVEQRPDVRQAEENLHAASAQIGVAIANRIPNLALSANLGAMALSTGRIGARGAEFWNITANLTQPIFQGGALLHKERAARAAYTQAAEQYRSTVVVAFQNVADVLLALKHDADALKAATAAKDAAATALDLAKKQYRAGYSGYVSVLNAEQAYQQAAIGFVQAQAARLADTVALFQALGGGWWHPRHHR